MARGSPHRRLDWLPICAVALVVGANFGAGVPVKAEPVPSAPPPQRNPGPPADAAGQPTRPSTAATSVDVRVLGLTASRERSLPGDDRRAEVAGRLIHTTVRVEVENATVAEVLGEFAHAVGVPILPLYVQRAGDPGLDRLERISVSVEQAPAFEALQSIIAAALGEGGTWQIHAGRVEVGPKWLLARDSAREIVALPIKDMLLEPPTVQSFGADIRAGLRERFPEAIVEIGPADRSTPDAVAAELLLQIERQVEPDAWIVDESMKASLARSGELGNPLARAGQWASMTSRDGVLVVTGPDFVLRGIRGYPGALAPAVDATGIANSSVVPPAAPVVAEQGGGRMVLIGFSPGHKGRRAAPAGSDRLSGAALESAGRLVHARLQVQLDNTTMRDAVELLGRTTGATLGPRWASETGPGIDAASRITLEMSDASGRDVLEMLLAMTDSSSTCGWQLSGSGVEFGPKTLLANSGTRRTVSVDVADLLIEAPYFIGPACGSMSDGLRAIITPLERNYGRELGMSRVMGPRGEIRKSPEFIAAELLLLLEKHVEPQGWLSTDAQIARRAARGQRDFEPLQRDGEWISATYRGGSLVITAPDFVLRGLVGYPTLPSPADGP